MRASFLFLIVASSLACSSNSGSTGTNGGLEVACPTGQTICGNTCTILSADPQNCGGCGAVCPAGQACIAGACATTCPTGSLLCSALCVDPLSDELNCGKCGTACGPSAACVNGTCTTTCPSDGLLCSGTCVEPRSDDLNCGVCGTACGTGTSCVDGGCAKVVVVTPPTTCGVGLTTCTLSDGGIDCSDIATDSFNCGGCGKSCPGGETCQNSQCVPSCVASELVCGGECVNTTSDSQNCGGCGGDGGVSCPAGEACSNSQCFSTCASPLSACPGLRPNFDGGFPDGGDPDAGYCADLGSDLRNCGTCGNSCAVGSFCLAGQCELVCPSQGQSCLTPFVLVDAGTITGNTCCGSGLGLSDAGCVADPSTSMLAYQLPQAGFTDLYTFQLTDGFVGTWTPEFCLSQANLTTLVCTNSSFATFPAAGQTDYIAIAQLDGGCGPFTLNVIVSSPF